MLDKVSRKRYIEITAVLFLLIVLLFINNDREYFVAVPENGSYIDAEKSLIIGLDSGLYKDSVSVRMTMDSTIPDKAEIYYTLNGDDPTAEKGTLYTSDILLEKTDDYTVYPLKAAIFYKGEYSDTVERTYILCDDVTNEFGIYIVCITSDSDNLYDYEKGILVAGKGYDDSFIKNGPDSDENIANANYMQRGDDWIRDAHATIFGSDGELLTDQNVGLGVSGGTSSVFGIKSLKLTAVKNSEGGTDKIKLTLKNPEDNDPDNSSNNNGSIDNNVNDGYESIRLRAGSQDIDYGNIRSAVASRLAQNSGFDGITSTTRCIVFLNGDFYSISDIQETYSSSNLADRFGLSYPKYVEKTKEREDQSLMKLDTAELFRQDLDDEMNRQALEAEVDMDNYLLYFAIEILMNNTDWTNNNFEYWRYTAGYDGDNPYTDERYRFLIFDTDLIYHTHNTPGWFDGDDGDVFEYLMEGTVRSKGSSFPYVMASDYYRDRFVTIVRDLLDTSFSTNNVLEIVDEENEKIAAARAFFFNSEYEANAEEEVLHLKEAVKSRPSEIKADLLRYFGIVY